MYFSVCMEGVCVCVCVYMYEWVHMCVYGVRPCIYGQNVVVLCVCVYVCVLTMPVSHNIPELLIKQDEY